MSEESNETMQDNHVYGADSGEPEAVVAATCLSGLAVLFGIYLASITLITIINFFTGV